MTIKTTANENLNINEQTIGAYVSNLMVDGDNIAPTFDSAAYYFPNSLVTYEGNLYRILSEHVENVTWENTEKVGVTPQSLLSERLTRSEAEAGFTDWDTVLPDGWKVESITYDSSNHDWLMVVIRSDAMFDMARCTGEEDSVQLSFTFASTAATASADRVKLRPTKTSELVDNSGYVDGDSTVVKIGKESIETSPTSTLGLKRAVAVGYHATASGSSTDGTEQSVAVGAYAATSGEASVAIGPQSVAQNTEAISIGKSAVNTGKQSVQLGAGTCTTNQTLRFRETTILKVDETTGIGTIEESALPSASTSGKGIVALSSPLTSDSASGKAVDAKVLGNIFASGFTEWVYTQVPTGWTIVSLEYHDYGSGEGAWHLSYKIGEDPYFSNLAEPLYATHLVFTNDNKSVIADRNLVRPTMTSQLENDSGYITLSDIPPPSAISDGIGNAILANRTAYFPNLEAASSSDYWNYTMKGLDSGVVIDGDGAKSYMVTNNLIPYYENGCWNSDINVLEGDLLSTYLSSEAYGMLPGDEVPEDIIWTATRNIPQNSDILSFRSEIPFPLHVTEGIPNGWTYSGPGYSSEASYQVNEEFYDDNYWYYLEADGFPIGSKSSSYALNYIEFDMYEGESVYATRTFKYLLKDHSVNLLTPGEHTTTYILPPSSDGYSRIFILEVKTGNNTGMMEILPTDGETVTWLSNDIPSTLPVNSNRCFRVTEVSSGCLLGEDMQYGSRLSSEITRLDSDKRDLEDMYVHGCPLSGNGGWFEMGGWTFQYDPTVGYWHGGDEDIPMYIHKDENVQNGYYYNGVDDGSFVLQQSNGYAADVNVMLVDYVIKGYVDKIMVESEMPQPVDISGKLDSSAAAPAFDSASAYDAGDFVTYQGNLYRFTSYHAASAWSGTDVETVSMTTPDATLDISGQGALRVVSENGDLLWQQGYTLSTSSSSYLINETVNSYVFAENAVGSVTLTLPEITDGKVADFILDVTNPPLNSSGAGYPSMTFDTASTYSVGDIVLHDDSIWKCVSAVETAGDWTGSENWVTSELSLGDALDNDISVVVPTGSTLADMFVIAPGEYSEFYFTLTAFRINGKPTYKIVKQTVENGGATA